MSTTIPKVDDLTQRLETAQKRIQVHELEQKVKVIESTANLVEGIGDVVSRTEYLNDTPGWYDGYQDSRLTTPQDRQHGAEAPFLRTEQDFCEQLGIGRYIAKTDSIAIGALENLKNYVVGTGDSYKFTPRAKPDPKKIKANDGKPVSEHDDLCAELSEKLDLIQEQTNWPLLERELLERSRRDGEFLAHPVWQNGKIRFRTELPEHITEPRDARTVEDFIGQVGLDWKFGVATIPGDPANVVGYFVQRYGDPSNWDFLPEDKAQFCKINSDADVKRGFSDFYCIYRDIERAAKLLAGTAEGATIQANIALIRQHAASTTEDQITRMVNNRATGAVNVSTNNGTAERKVQRSVPGTILDVTATEILPGVMGGTNAPDFIAVVQAAMRKAGIRWCMPEYIISADASNANFASTMVAESPFVKAMEAMQRFYAHHFRELMWKALALLNERERFCESIEELRKTITLEVTPPQVAVRNRKEDNDMYKIQADAGLLSDRTWAEKVDLDYDAEQAKGAKKATVPGYDADGMPLDPLATGNPVGKKDGDKDGVLDEANKKKTPVMESTRFEEARKLLWGDYPVPVKEAS